MNDYHSDTKTVSRTMLNLFFKSRLEYYYTYVSGEMPRRAPSQVMEIGTVLHSMLLENKCLSDMVLAYPADCLTVAGAINRKRCDEFEAEFPGFVYLKQRDYDRMGEACEAALDRVGELQAIIAGAHSREQRFDANIEGVDCRCKPDIVSELEDCVVVHDLKFSEKIDPDSFRRSAKNLRYWVQDAHYSAVVARHFKKPVSFRFCNVETVFPYRVQWYWYDRASRDEASRVHRTKIGELAECYRSGDWTDDWDSVLNLSPWGVESDELVEVQ